MKAKINKRYKLIPAVFLILEKGKGKNIKILLSRRFNTGHEDGNYGFPSGHLEPTESYTDALVREINEEIGIKVLKKDLEFVQASHNYYNSKNDHDPYINIFFICRKWKGDIVNMEPDKCDDLSWFPIDKLPKNTIKYIKIVVENIRNQKYYSEIKK